MCCYQGCFDAIYKIITYQLLNNQIDSVVNRPQGENICSSEPNIVWIWSDFFNKVSDEKCFEHFGCSNDVLCCYHSCFDSIHWNNACQLMKNQLDIIGNGPQINIICSSEANLWASISNKGSIAKCCALFFSIMTCCAAIAVVLTPYMEITRTNQWTTTWSC